MFGGRGSSRAGVAVPVTVPKLQREIKELKIKHKEETYWLQLELDTMKREKEAVEKRMSELFRDMQELQDPSLAATTNHDTNLPNGEGDSVMSDDSEAILHAKLKKYANMVKALNNQIILVRHSSEQIVKNLKDEIKDVVDASSVTEKELLNELEKMQKENESLKAKLSGGSNSSSSATSMELKAQVEELQKEKADLVRDLKVERLQSRDTISHLRQEKTRLSEMLERMQGDVLLLRSTAAAAQGLEQIRLDRDESLQALERVALLWDKADEAIQSLEGVMEELKIQNSNKDGPELAPHDRESALSTLETASLVHGQVKVALMLIELKLRNGLMSLKNDAAEVGSVSAADPAIVDTINLAQDESMAAIAKVEESLKLQMEHLEHKSVAETKQVKENLESRVRDLKEMQARQKELEQQVNRMSVEELGTLAQKNATAEEDKSVQLFVSRKILERLQTEVLQVVARVKEKNETIGRLQAMVEEHKARENTLIEELRRMMKVRGDGGPDRRVGSSFESTGEFEEEEVLEEEVEEEIVDEEILLEEEEEEEEEETTTDYVEEEVLETSSLS